MPQQDNFTRFAIATVTICIPSYLLIFSLNSDTWLGRYRAMLLVMREFLAHPFSQHRSESERPRNWWSRLWEPKSDTTLQKQRQSRSVTDYEDQASNSQKSAIPVSQRGSQRPSFPQPTTTTLKENGVRFDLPSFDRRPRLGDHEKTFSDPGPLSTLPEEDLSSTSAARRGLFKTITDRISGQNSPRSPV